jgi:glycosyltransferase involved in cell wall biosynthesis
VGISVVIPVFNSGIMLPELTDRLRLMLSGTGQEHEVLLVNDGSSDESWDVIRSLAAKYSWIRGVDLLRNFGQHNALLAGIRAARYEVVVTMDDDLQNPPEEVPKLLARLKEGWDVVYGVPVSYKHGFLRDMASYITKLTLQNAMGVETACKVSAFRVFRTRLRDAFSDYNSPFVSIDVLLTWGGTRFSSLVVNHKARRSGTSNYTYRKLIVHALNMMTGFSVVPLQIASLVGFVSMLFGICVLIWVVGSYCIRGGSVPGFSFLACSIAIFSGAQLFAIGIIGEYLARMHFRMMARPAYVVREETSNQ